MSTNGSTVSDYKYVPLIKHEPLSDEQQKENEFGELTSDAYRFKVHSREGKPIRKPVIDTPPYYISLVTYLNYLILIILGHIHDFLGMRLQETSTWISLSMTVWRHGSPILTVFSPGE